MNDRGGEAGNALIFGSGARLKAAPRKELSLAVPPDPFGWMAV